MSPIPRVSALCAALLLLVAGSALAGPPWISIEVPANPNMREARGALLLVRAYHHDRVRAYRVTGVAEGVVDGKRRSVPLDVDPTSTAGLYAVPRPELEEGRWILVLTLEGGDTDASALVELDGGGEVAGVRVPTSGTVEGFTFPRAANEADVEAMLASGDGSSADDTPGAPLTAAAGLLVLGIAVPLIRIRKGR